ncbi:hypothetical protein H6G06_09795 [Anabaena sphaerica FACHB-251]|uniref:Uncharacterized protein n=1 Tax=Anabaena sphaerica FACHB-251 TaxID=2692883 RepID=A0A926WFT5_9NOST|nr:hypothetical protein [Anabaena sphaerica]MBD2293776.1 hypothetical protein [Anabaena sphaerica FACHB-251]
MALIDGLADDNKRQTLVADCTNLLETQVASIGGISGLAIKAGYGAIKGISPGYCAGAIERLLPQSFAALEPIWEEGLKTDDPARYLIANRSRTADALLSVTDVRIQKSSNSTLKGIYNKLRNSVKNHVEEAVPGLAQILNKYTA